MWPNHVLVGDSQGATNHWPRRPGAQQALLIYPDALARGSRPVGKLLLYIPHSHFSINT